MKTWKKPLLCVCGLAAFCVAAFFSCTSPLERKGMRLRAGMDENEVRALFQRCELVAVGHGGVKMHGNAKVLEDNVPADSMLLFRARKPFIFDFESLSVYFDSNGKVVAYYFERPS